MRQANGSVLKYIEDEEVLMMFKKLMPRVIIIDECKFSGALMEGCHTFMLEYHVSGFRDIEKKMVHFPIDILNHPIQINEILTKILLSVYGDTKDLFMKPYAETIQ